MHPLQKLFATMILLCLVALICIGAMLVTRADAAAEKAQDTGRRIFFIWENTLSIAAKVATAETPKWTYDPPRILGDLPQVKVGVPGGIGTFTLPPDWQSARIYEEEAEALAKCAAILFGSDWEAANKLMEGLDK